MSSKISMKNNLGNTLTISHSDDVENISIDSVDLSKVITINSLSELKDKVGGSKHKPPTIWISGYHTKGDNAFGSHIFEWDENCTENHNGGTIIDPDAVFPTDWTDGTQVNSWYNYGSVTSGRYKLRYNGAVNVKWFGAVGDGVTDDTIAIQNTLLNSLLIEFVSKDTYLVSQTLTPKEGSKLYGNGCNFTTNSDIEAIFLPESLVNIDNITFSEITTFSVNVAVDTLASAGIMLKNVNGCRINNCSFFKYYIGIRIVSTNRGQSCSRHHISNCDFTNGFIPSDSAFADINQFGIVLGSNVMPANTVIGSYEQEAIDAKDVSGIVITNNRFYGGQYGIANHRASNVSIVNNYFTKMSRGISNQQQSRTVSIVGNTFKDMISTGVHMGYGVENIAIIGNAFTGTMTNDNVFIQAYYGCKFIIISSNNIDSKYDGTPEFDNRIRTPKFGIRIGQKTTDVIIANNNIRGVKYGIEVLSTIYPDIITSNDPNYYNTGFKNIKISSNNIYGDYYDNNYVKDGNVSGIRFVVSASWEDSTLGGINPENLICDGNVVDNVYYPYAVKIEPTTSSNPIDVLDFKFSNNKAGEQNDIKELQFPGIISNKDTYNDEENSWQKSFFQYNTFKTFTNVTTANVLNLEKIFLNTTTNTTFTEFLNGKEGQILIVRLSSQLTIKYDSSKIRLKGNTDITNVNSNNYITLINTSGIWFEINRNF